MNALELSQNIGKTGLIPVNGQKHGAGMLVEVKIVNAREVFGRLDYQVTPVTGSGLMWIEAARVSEVS